MKIKIESNIPIPSKGNPKYPFRELEIGQSFLVPHSARAMIGAIGRSHKRKYISRKVNDQFIRIWRIK